MRGLLANWSWLLLFSAFSLGFIVGGWSASNDGRFRQQAERTRAAEQSVNQPKSLVSEVHSQQDTSDTQTREKHSSWIANFFELKLTDAIIAIFTIVLAVKTSGLFTETAGLRSAADRQAQDMKASIAVADKAANAAIAQANIIVRTERPYIFVIPMNEGGSPFDPERKVSYFIRNHGRTPAIIESVSMGLRVISDFTTAPDYRDMFKGETRMVIEPQVPSDRDRLPQFTTR
jgi:hypothetical protein